MLISALVIRQPENTANNMGNFNIANIDSNNMMQMPYPRRDPDLLVPITNILRIMKRVLPVNNAKISEEAKGIIQECVSEYVSFITGEANDHCHSEHRKTITADDIIHAHAKLGFDDYVAPLTLFLNRYRQSESAHTAVHGDFSVGRTTVYPDHVHAVRTPPSMLVHAPPPPPPPPPPMNAAFQVGMDQQGFFNPALMMNNYYFPNSPTASHAGGFDTGGSSSNAEFPEGLPPPGFYPHGHGQFK